MCVKSPVSAGDAAASAPRSAQMPAGNDAFSTLQPAITVPSLDSSAAPTRKSEYGAYARAIAAAAASRKRRGGPRPGARPHRATISGRNDVPAPRNASPIHSATVAPRSANVARRPIAHGPHTRTKREQRNVFAGMIGRRRRRIVAVVGGDEEQIVLVEGGGDGRKGVIELP